MYKIVSAILLMTMSLAGCSKLASTEPIASTEIPVTAVSLVAAESSSAAQADSKADEFIEPEEYEEYELSFVVSVADGYNYDSLRSVAVASASLLNFQMDTSHSYYHPEKGIILPEDDEDEIWAGEYLLRRTGDRYVSLEMHHAYPDTSLKEGSIAQKVFLQDSTRMFVFATLYTTRHEADSLLKVLKPQFPKAKVIATEIYQGCMH